jgi:hypothetical protein
MYMPPKKPVPVASSAHLDTYQLGSYAAPDPSEPNPAYGVVIGHALYVPRDDTEVGVDRLYILDWRNNMVSESPERALTDNDGHPEPRVMNAEWSSALGHPARHPITATRAPLGQSANAMVLFQGGLLGATPWDDAFYKFPDAVIPTSVALTNGNEFVLVTVWDTTNPDAPVGRLAVLMAHWGLPTVGVGYTHRYDGGAVQLTLLGYVDLPFATPTFVTAAGDNGYGASIDIYFSPSVAELADPAVREKNAQNGNDQYTWSPIGASGYAVVLSRWENKAAFIDLQPLYQAVQTWLLGSQANYDEATGGSTTPLSGRWPRTFDTAPEQRPAVIATLDVAEPTTALAGRGPKLVDRDQSKAIKAHVASLDGTIRTFDVADLGKRHAAPPGAIREMYSTKLDYNPTSMAWSGDVDPRDPTTARFGSLRASFSDSFIVLSRAEREIAWVHATETAASTFRRVRDSRLDDPVAIDKMNAFHDAYVISIADFSSSKIVTYRIGPIHDEFLRPRAEIPSPSGPDAIECGGELSLTGRAFQVVAGNVP